MKFSAKYIWIFVIFGILVVGVTGWFWYEKNQSKPSALQESQSSGEDDNKSISKFSVTSNQESHVLLEDLDVSTWKTYENKKVGVRIKYPERWKVVDLEDDKAGFALRSPEYVPIQSGMVFYDGEIYISSYANPKQLSIKDLFQTFDDGSGLWFSQYNHEDVIIGGRNAVHFPEIVEGDGREGYYVSGKKALFLFSYHYPLNQKDQRISEIFRKIVENFESLN